MLIMMCVCVCVLTCTYVVSQVYMLENVSACVNVRFFHTQLHTPHACAYAEVKRFQQHRHDITMHQSQEPQK